MYLGSDCKSRLRTLPLIVEKNVYLDFWEKYKFWRNIFRLLVELNWIKPIRKNKKWEYLIVDKEKDYWPRVEKVIILMEL